MDISSLPLRVNAAALPMEKLEANPRLSEEEKIGELGRQFETVLLRQILRDAQKTVFKSSILSESAATSVYQDMIAEQFADSISRSGSLGLGDSLRRQLTRELSASGPETTSHEGKPNDN